MQVHSKGSAASTTSLPVCAWDSDTFLMGHDPLVNFTHECQQGSSHVDQCYLL